MKKDAKYIIPTFNYYYYFIFKFYSIAFTI